MQQKQEKAKKKRAYKNGEKNAKKPKPFDKCYVCDRFVGASGERDHFPISHAEGGTQVMTICDPCHTLKDRITIEHWDADIAFASLRNLWIKCLPEERLWLTKIFHICSMQAATIVELMEDETPLALNEKVDLCESIEYII